MQTAGSLSRNVQDAENAQQPPRFEIELDPDLINQIDQRFGDRNLVIPSHTTFMTPFQKESLKFVWSELRNRERAFQRFFDRLFYRFPQEQECFERLHGMSDQQIEKVVTCIQDLVDSTYSGDRGNVDEQLEKLAREHRDFGVKKDNFQRFSKVLLEFMVEEMGDDVTEFDLDAWTIALKIIVNVMGVALG